MFSFFLLFVYCFTTSDPFGHHPPPFGFQEHNSCGTSDSFLLEKHSLRLDTCAVLCLTAAVNCTGFDYRENSRHCILRNGTSSHKLEVCPKGVRHYQRACIYGDAPHARYYILGDTWTDNDCSCQCELNSLEATCICGGGVGYEENFYQTPFGVMLICICAGVWILLFCGCCLLWRVIEARPENGRFSTRHIGSLDFAPYASPSIGSFDSLSPGALGVGVPPFKVILPNSSVESPTFSNMKVSISHLQKSKGVIQDAESPYAPQSVNKDSKSAKPDPLLVSWNAAFDARYGDANDASTSPPSCPIVKNYRNSKSE